MPQIVSYPVMLSSSREIVETAILQRTSFEGGDNEQARAKAPALIRKPSATCITCLAFKLHGLLTAAIHRVVPSNI